MSRNYKDVLRYGRKRGGPARRYDIAKMAVEPADIQLDTLLLEDYDRAVLEWVEKELPLTFEGKELPTVALYASQRFSEYMQSWMDTDRKKNFLMNFKVLTRENNPKPGTMYGDTRNIPEGKYFLIKRVETVDGNGRPLFLDFRMRQPYCVDITYTVSVVTNKFRLLNTVNEMLNRKFSSITGYLNVKGHYVSMIMNDISDESEYQIDDRQYFSQSYKITVRGYLIRSEDYQVVEEPKLQISCFERGMDKAGRCWADIEEADPCYRDKNVYKGLKITVALDICAVEHSFTVDEAIVIDNIELVNVKRFRISKNGEEVFSYSAIEGDKPVDIRFLPGDVLLIDRILKTDMNAEKNEIILSGYNPFDVVDRVKKKR